MKRFLYECVCNWFDYFKSVCTLAVLHFFGLTLTHSLTHSLTDKHTLSHTHLPSQSSSVSQRSVVYPKFLACASHGEVVVMKTAGVMGDGEK